MSDAGYESARNCMRLNHTIGEITDNFHEYGEYVYFLSIFGTPSATEPWGWQLDGHHVNLHCFVLGDQLVFTPAFLGSEPVIATTGKFSGVSVMQEEEQTALAFMQGLDRAQQTTAILSDEIQGCLRRRLPRQLRAALRRPPRRWPQQRPAIAALGRHRHVRRPHPRRSRCRQVG